MNKYLIRFNKSRGQPGRGSKDHAWRIFEGDKEYIVKHVVLEVPCRDEISGDGLGNDDWNFACNAYMTLDKATATATFSAKKPK
jgi:hypothetical protein